MAVFKDLDPLPYFGKWQELLTAVGWLGTANDFLKGKVTEDFFEALVRLCVDPWQPFVTAGWQPCSFCRFTNGPGQLSYRGMKVSLGAANVFVPADLKVFVAPTMILHYIDAHDYAPPAEFQDAVVHCPEMKSIAYFKQLKLRGLTIT